MTWQLRRADETDLESILTLESATFGPDAWSRQTLRGELRSPHCWYLVAFRPETPATIEAYAGLFVAHGANEADIQTIAVAPAARGSGLGRVMMRTLLAEAVRRGAREVFLEVRADNPVARELYRRLGFEQIAVRPGYYQPDGVDAVVMRLKPARREASLADPEDPPLQWHHEARQAPNPGGSP